jgi:hypothetical protein
MVGRPSKPCSCAQVVSAWTVSLKCSATRRRLVVLGLLRALATAVALVALYYLLPLDHITSVPLGSAGGLLILLAVIALHPAPSRLRQLRPAIRNALRPRTRLRPLPDAAAPAQPPRMERSAPRPLLPDPGLLQDTGISITDRHSVTVARERDIRPIVSRRCGPGRDGSEPGS